MRKAPHGLLPAPAAATPGATEKQRRASVLMRQHLMFFNEADVDGDSALDFEEFVSALPENVRTAHPLRKLRQFFEPEEPDCGGQEDRRRRRITGVESADERQLSRPP